MTRRSIVAAALLALPAAAAAQEHAEHASPYAPLHGRDIKALSAEDVRGLLEGEGMGFALAAELNGYPGPRHVLELADSLHLAPGQAERTRAVMDAMASEARALGARVVEAERTLDRAFAAGTVTAQDLRESTRAIGALRAELRAVHLAAHLSTVAILTEHQRLRYQELRGYGGAHGIH